MGLVDNIPEATTEGPRAIPNPTGDGVFHIYGFKIYELTCDTNACSWTTRQQELPVGKSHFGQAFYIPEKLVNCS